MVGLAEEGIGTLSRGMKEVWGEVRATSSGAEYEGIWALTVYMNDEEHEAAPMTAPWPPLIALLVVRDGCDWSERQCVRPTNCAGSHKHRTCSDANRISVMVHVLSK